MQIVLHIIIWDSDVDEAENDDVIDETQLQLVDETDEMHKMAAI